VWSFLEGVYSGGEKLKDSNDSFGILLRQIELGHFREYRSLLQLSIKLTIIKKNKTVKSYCIAVIAIGKSKDSSTSCLIGTQPVLLRRTRHKIIFFFIQGQMKGRSYGIILYYDYT